MKIEALRSKPRGMRLLPNSGAGSSGNPDAPSLLFAPFYKGGEKDNGILHDKRVLVIRTAAPISSVFVSETGAVF